MSEYDGPLWHGDVELGVRVAPRLVDELAALLVEREPGDVHRAVRRRHLEARPPDARALRRHPHEVRLRRTGHASRLPRTAHNNGTGQGKPAASRRRNWLIGSFVALLFFSSRCYAAFLLFRLLFLEITVCRLI